VSGIAWLGDDACHDPATVGAKAAHLSRLSSIHLVPPGFAVTAVDASVPREPALLSAIAAAYRRLRARTGLAAPPMAVRSSAVDEDGAGASFAGQHETFLNVRGEDAVIAAFERCCASALSSVATQYRAQQGLTTARPQIAVLVQQLVASETSAVAFSANPITGARDQVMVTAAWGLGESVVGGTVTPDLYVLGRPALRVLERHISSKQVMTVLTEGGTTADVPVPDALRDRSSLTNSQLLEIGRLVVKLERAMGWPVDVECALAYDELYLLQCRPITALPG